MSRHALIGPGNVLDRLASNVDPTVQTRSGWKWLPCDPVVPPTFDATSETVDGPSYVVGASYVTETWTKRNLVTQELSDRKDAAVSGLNGGGFSPILKMFFNIHNRVLTLESKPTITLAQFKAALKAIL